jgi:tRNA pseudouridine38-40 synthase
VERYFVKISFRGTRYHGWQIQPNAVTVQEVIEKALSTIMREKITAVGAGRTDTGVHASFFVFHFNSNSKDIDTDKLVFRLNCFLLSDISVHLIRRVPPDAHARFSALSRTYNYYLTQLKDPFQTETAYYFPRKLNINKMNAAASLLKYYSDFTSFSKLHTDVKTNLCKIFTAEWHKKDNSLVFTIKADRFLRNMVRAIVGTLVLVGRGKIDIDDFRTIIESRNRSAAGPSAPAHGLFLSEIEYPEHILI